MFGLESGAKIEATYMGVALTGVVTHTRAHTINREMQLTFVDNDETFTVPGIRTIQAHEGLLITSQWDGSERDGNSILRVLP